MFRANDVDLRNARIANAEIWIKGNASEELTTVEKEIYAQMVYMLNEKYWVIGEQNKLLGLDQWKGLAAADFAGFLHEKPLAQRLWRERNDRLRHYRGIASPNEATTPAWRNSVESALAKFEQSTAGEE